MKTIPVFPTPNAPSSTILHTGGGWSIFFRRKLGDLEIFDVTVSGDNEAFGVPSSAVRFLDLRFWESVESAFPGTELQSPLQEESTSEMWISGKVALCSRFFFDEVLWCLPTVSNTSSGNAPSFKLFALPNIFELDRRSWLGTNRISVEEDPRFILAVSICCFLW